MELGDYLRIVRRRWLLISVFVLITTSAAAIATMTATPLYSSTARLFVTTSDTASGADLYQGGLASAQRATSYADLVTSRQLAERVISDLQLDEAPGELMAQVHADVVPETVIIEVTAVNPDPKMAQTLAQGYADALTELVSRVETTPGSTTPQVKATVVDPASLGTTPISPRPLRNLVLGALLGLALGVAVAVLRERLDNSVKTPEEVTGIAGAPLLGAISFDSSARTKPLVTALDSHAPRVESFRVLRTNLQFVDVDSATKVFVVTSALPEEGKTTTSVNLAITLAQAGHKTLLVEGDLRRPKATQALELDNEVGVTTVLLGQVPLEDALQKHADSDLHVVGSGAIPPNPAELLQSNAMADLLKQIRHSYDVVIVDAPPLLPVTDAALLAAQADGAMVVVRYGKTTRDQLAQAVERLTQVDASPVGMVLNMVPNRRRRYGYGGYGYSSGYGYGPATTS